MYSAMYNVFHQKEQNKKHLRPFYVLCKCKINMFGLWIWQTPKDVTIKDGIEHNSILLWFPTDLEIE